MYYIFIRGISGSGKTVISKGISTKLGCEHLNPDFLYINELEFSSFKKNHKNIPRLKRLKYLFLLNKAKGLVSKKQPFVWDQPWRNISGINKTLKRLNLCDENNYFIFTISISPEQCWKRNLKNNGKIQKIFKNKESYFEFNDKFEYINDNNVFHTIKGENKLNVNINYILSIIYKNVQKQHNKNKKTTTNNA